MSPPRLSGSRGRPFVRWVFALSALPALLALSLGGCPAPETCDEDPRAQILERVEVSVGGARIEAELADSLTERERGWKHRRCGREALLLVAALAEGETATELPVWGCGLVEAVEVHWILDGQITAAAIVEPCAEPCGACPSLGEGTPAQAALELDPSLGLELELGTLVSW